MTDDNTNTGIPEPEGAAAVIDTDYEVGQDNIQRSVGPFGLDIHNPVFLISGLGTVLFTFYALIFNEQAATVFGELRPWLTSAW